MILNNQFYFHFYRKNPLKFLGVAIGKFVEVKASSLIDNYFNKGISKEINYNQQQSNEPSESSTSFTEQQEGSKKSSPISKQLSSNLSVFYSSAEKNETYTNSLKNTKTMSTQIKNFSNLVTNFIETETNVNSNPITENKCKSFFCSKLKIISPIKTLENEKSNTDVPSHSKSFFSKKLEIISPSKKVDQQNHEMVSFFAKKLEMISPSKNQTNSATILTVQSPVTKNRFEDAPMTLLCEHCNQMIDIDQYDEHVDFHIAVNLSKSLNTADIQPTNNDELHKNKSTKKKKNERGQKRKCDSKESKLNPKKSCTSISLYFKPVLNSK